MGVSGIILAGGRSSRMGFDKTMLLINNQTLIEQTIAKVTKFTDEIIIASNHKSKYNFPNLKEVPDTYQNMGPLGGIHAGLLAAKNDYSFVVSSDMPFFTENLAAYLLERKEGYDVVVAQIQDNLEPLCAVYSKNCIKPIEQCLKSGISRVYFFYPQVRVLKIGEPQLNTLGDTKKLFCNLNTPEDVEIVLNRSQHST